MNWTLIKNTVIKTAKKYFTAPVLLALLFILLSHPLFYALAALSQSLSPAPLSVLPGVIYYFPQTGMKLISYIVSVPIFFLYYALFFYLVNHPSFWITKKYIRILHSRKKTLLWFASAFLVAILAKHTEVGALKLLLSTVPLVCPLITPSQWSTLYNKRLPKVLFCTVLGAICWLGYITLPFIFTPLQVENDYLNIPTYFTAQTRPHADINTNHAFYTHYSPLITLGTRTTHCMPVSNTEGLENMAHSDSSNADHAFEVKNGQLCLSWILNPTEKQQILDQLTPAQQLEFNTLYAPLQSQYQRLVHPDAQELKEHQTFELLRSETHWQVLARGFIHHHNHLFGAAHAYLKGQPVHQIFMQYGFLNTTAIAWVLNNTVGFNYSNYIHFYYVFYPLYYLFLFWFGWIILKNAKYVGIQILLSVGALSFSSYMFLKLAPGINPARHFFDIFTVVTLYLYLAKKQKAWLLFSVASVWVSLLNNMHFGAFIFVSLAGVLFIKNITDWKNRSRFELLSLVGLMLGGAVSFFLANVGSKQLEGYFLSGLLGFGIRNTLLYIILLCTGLIYLLLAYNWNKKDPLNYTLLLLVFYSQGVMLYFLRSAVIIHFYTMFSTFTLMAVVAIKLFFSIIFKHYPAREKAAQRILLLGSALFFLASLSPFLSSKKEMLMKFKGRQVYFWNLPNTFFHTTMPLKPFAQGAALINKYATEPGIYMVSQYDNIFPLIADKYNAMPMIDMQWYLITQKELDLAVNAIKNNRPEYLFVDSDIDRNYYLDILPRETPLIGYLHDESLWRAQRLSQMQKVFKAIEENYEPVEKSELITAYKRKPLP